MYYGVRDKTQSADEKKFLMTHNSGFWNKNINQEDNDKDFSEALERIKTKQNRNVIDERLINIIEDFNS